MSHFIGKFTVDSSGKKVRFTVESERTLLLSPQDAQKLGNAFKTNREAELVFAGETGQHLVLKVEPTPTGDRQLSIELRLPVIGAQAQQLGAALIEEASRIP